MKAFLLLASLPLLVCFPSFGQISLSNGNHNLEISGSISTYYTARFYTSGNEENHINDDLKLGFDKGKNKFALRDAQLKLEGRIGKIWNYDFQMDFADLLNKADIGENPGLLDANVTYKGIPFLDVIAGYQKLPYSRNSLVPFNYSPYWQRSEMTRGEFFSRRDIGVTFHSALLNERLNVYLGTYSGLGEQVLTMYGGDNDPSGTLEALGRIDFAWPSRYRYRDYDVNSSPIPMFAVGLAGRYVERKYSSFIQGDDYYLRVIAGKRTMVTADLSCQYKGFSGQVEFHGAEYRPTNDVDPDAGNARFRENRGTKSFKIGTKPTDFFRAGGIVSTLSYSNRKLKSIFSVRYDNFNPNDVIEKNTEETLSFAYAYMLNGFNAVIKAQYWHRLVDRKNPLIQRFDDQIRIGINFLLQ
jgi:hypothetical protein